MEKDFAMIVVEGSNNAIRKYNEELTECDIEDEQSFINFLYHFTFLIMIRRLDLSNKLDTWKVLEIMSEICENQYPGKSKSEIKSAFFGEHVRINDEYFGDLYTKFFRNEPLPLIKKIHDDYYESVSLSSIQTLHSVLLELIEMTNYFGEHVEDML